jgi:hypothetical protein
MQRKPEVFPKDLSDANLGVSCRVDSYPWEFHGRSSIALFVYRNSLLVIGIQRDFVGILGFSFNSPTIGDPLSTVLFIVFLLFSIATFASQDRPTRLRFVTL